MVCPGIPEAALRPHLSIPTVVLALVSLPAFAQTAAAPNPAAPASDAAPSPEVAPEPAEATPEAPDGEADDVPDDAPDHASGDAPGEAPPDAEAAPPVDGAARGVDPPQPGEGAEEDEGPAAPQVEHRGEGERAQPGQRPRGKRYEYEGQDDRGSSSSDDDGDLDRPAPPRSATTTRSSPWGSVGAAAGACAGLTCVPAVCGGGTACVSGYLSLTPLAAAIPVLSFLLPLALCGSICGAGCASGPLGAAGTAAAAALTPWLVDDDEQGAMDALYGSLPSWITGGLAALLVPLGVVLAGFGGLNVALFLLGAAAAGTLIAGLAVLSAGMLVLGMGTGLALVTPTLAFAGVAAARLPRSHEESPSSPVALEPPRTTRAMRY